MTHNRIQKGRGTKAVPGAWLEDLASELNLSGMEWRVVALVLAAGPVTAHQVAKSLRRNYAHVKRAVRELLRWRVLQRTSEGIVFQSDSNLWGPPVVPVRRSAHLGPPPKMGGPIRPGGSPKEVVLE